MAVKRKIVERVSLATGIHEEDVSFIYDAIFNEIPKLIIEEGSLTIKGFGKFITYKTKERGKLNTNFKSNTKIKYTISQTFFNTINKK